MSKPRCVGNAALNTMQNLDPKEGQAEEAAAQEAATESAAQDSAMGATTESAEEGTTEG